MLAAHIELILLITGLATAGALVLFLAPVTMMKMLFGQAPSDALSLLIARHWGLLVCLVGTLLIYAAYHAEVRVPTLIVAIVEKAALRARRVPLALPSASGGAGHGTGRRWHGGGVRKLSEWSLTRSNVERVDR